MTIQELIDRKLFEEVSIGRDLDRSISEVFCCDLLSVAMGKAPADGAWITVMGNMNTLAVAELAEVGCIVLAEGASLDAMAMKKAQQEEITVFRTLESIFHAAILIHELL